MSQSKPKIGSIADDIRKLSLKEKAELKSILDEILLEDRKALVYSNYHDTMAAMIRTGQTSSSDIALLTGITDDN